MRHQRLTYLFVACLLLLSMSTEAATNLMLVKSHGRPYSLSVLANYSYNTPWQHHGGGELRAFLPVNQHVDILANFQALSSDVYTISGTVRPRFALPVGEMYFDASALYSAVQRSATHDFVGAMSLGYKMDYLNMQIGCFTRSIAPYGRTWNSNEDVISEPFNLLYRISFNVRPLCERWNIFFGAGNFNQTRYERMWQPHFFVGGYYDFPPANSFEYEYNAASHFRLLAEAEILPTGMFHLNANFYGATVRFGFAYKF